MTSPSETPPPETSGSYYHAPHNAEDLASSLRQLYLLVRRRIRMILLLVAVGTGLAAYFGYSRTPVYTARRDIAFDRYRKGNPTSATYPDADKAKLSEIGK